MHSEYNTQEHTAILHMRNKNALMKYGNERASNHEINFSFGFLNLLENQWKINFGNSKIIKFRKLCGVYSQ